MDSTVLADPSMDAKPGARLDPQTRAKRLGLQLRVLHRIGIFYAMNACLGFLALAVDVLPWSAAIGILCAGLLHYGAFYYLFTKGLVSSQGDSFLAVPQSVLAIAIVLGFSECYPQMMVLMISLLPLIFCFGALAFEWSTAIKLWSLVSAVTGVLLFRHRTMLQVPHETPGQLLFTSLFYADLFLCYLGVGLFGSQLRIQLYRRNKALAEATAKIEILANRDELTGSLNRRAICSALNHEILAAPYRRSTLAIALMDIDHFKQINDRHGHSQGDEVLREFVTAVSASTRSHDLLGRYGGEEFLLILPETTEDAVSALAERIREAVAGKNWSGIAPNLNVTVSIGVAIYSREESMAGLIQRADQALYAAKHKGRNRICMAA